MGVRLLPALLCSVRSRACPALVDALNFWDGALGWFRMQAQRLLVSHQSHVTYGIRPARLQTRPLSQL